MDPDGRRRRRFEVVVSDGRGRFLRMSALSSWLRRVAPIRVRSLASQWGRRRGNCGRFEGSTRRPRHADAMQIFSFCMASILVRLCTHKTRRDVRFEPKATEFPRCSEMSRCAISGREQLQQNGAIRSLGVLRLITSSNLVIGTERTPQVFGTSPRAHQALALNVNGPSWRPPSRRLRMRASSCWRRPSGSDTT